MSDLESTSDRSVNGTSLYGLVKGLEQKSLTARKVYKSSTTYLMSELESAFTKSVNRTSFEGLEQMSRVAANIYISHNTYFKSGFELEISSDKSLIGPSLYDLGVERFEDFEARMAVTEGGNRRLCLTASRSRFDRIGVRESSRGGRGGGGLWISMLKLALGGGGKGPATECTPVMV